MNVEYPGASVGGNSEIHPHLVMAIYGALRARPARTASRPTTAAPLRSWPSAASIPTPASLRQSDQRGLRLGRAGDQGRQQRPLHPERELRPAADRDPRDALPDPARGARDRTRVGRRGPQPRRLRLLPAVPRRVGGDARLRLHREGEDRARGDSSAASRARTPAILVRRAGRDDFQTFTRGVRTSPATASSRTSIWREGDSIRIVTSGGGGYGDPARARPRADRGGRAPGLHVDASRRSEDYRVVFVEGSDEIDRDRTEQLRAAVKE